MYTKVKSLNVLDIDGCGLSCKDYFYEKDQQKELRMLISGILTILIALHVFTIATFSINWNTGNKYPAKAIFYMNVCFLISCCGCLIQYLGNGFREEIVCKKDKTLRISEPNADNLSCVFVFIIIYFFFMASIFWTMIFTYCWYMSSLQALGECLHFLGIPHKKRTNLNIT